MFSISKVHSDGMSSCGVLGCRGDTALIGGSEVFADRIEDLIALFREGASKAQLVVTANTDQVIELSTNCALRRAYEQAGVVTMDSVPLQRFLKFRFGVSVHRVAGSDLLAEVGNCSDARLRIALLGGGTEVGEKTVEKLKQRGRGDSVRWIPLPWYADTRIEALRSSKEVAELREFSPDVAFILLGSPKQELWYLANREELPSAYYVGAGAAAAMYVGVERRAPLWLQRMGLEWSWRLMRNPKRLFFRYVIRSPKVFPILIQSRRCENEGAAV